MLATLCILSCISEPDPRVSVPELTFTTCSLLLSPLTPLLAVSFATGMYFLEKLFLLLSPEIPLDILLSSLLICTLESANECRLVANCLAEWRPCACSFCLTLLSDNTGVLLRGLSSWFWLIVWASFSFHKPGWYCCPAAWSSLVSLSDENALFITIWDWNVPGRGSWRSPVLFWNKRFQWRNWGNYREKKEGKKFEKKKKFCSSATAIYTGVCRAKYSLYLIQVRCRSNSNCMIFITFQNRFLKIARVIMTQSRHITVSQLAWYLYYRDMSVTQKQPKFNRIYHSETSAIPYVY